MSRSTPTDRLLNLIEERVAVALRVCDVGLEDPGLISRRIASGRMVLVASPAYMAEREPIVKPAQGPAQHTISGLCEGAEQSWNLVTTDGRTAKLQHRPRLLCSDYTVQFEAAAGRVGIALLPLRIAWRGLESGALVQVAKDWGTAEQSIHLVYVSRCGMLPSVRSLVDHLVQHIPTALA